MWEEVSIEFESGEADAVLVLCRYKQDIETAGNTVWFSDVTLTAVDE